MMVADRFIFFLYKSFIEIYIYSYYTRYLGVWGLLLRHATKWVVMVYLLCIFNNNELDDNYYLSLSSNISMVINNCIDWRALGCNHNNLTWHIVKYFQTKLVKRRFSINYFKYLFYFSKNIFTWSNSCTTLINFLFYCLSNVNK